MKGPHSTGLVNSEHFGSGIIFVTNDRPQRRLPRGAPPVVTYSRLREEELAAHDDGRAEPRFDDEPVAAWDAVEVPHVEPPLHGRRRSRPLVEEVRTPLDDAYDPGAYDDPEGAAAPRAQARKDQPKRSATMRLVTVAAVALIAIGVGVLAYALTSTSSVPGRAPTLSEGGTAEPGTLPADGTADAIPAARTISLDGGSDSEAAAAPPPAPSTASLPADEPAATAPVAPPAPRARPEPPASVATAVEPDFDQALPGSTAPAVPQTASAPAGGDDDFISNIERTLERSRGGSASAAPTLSPASEPVQLLPPPGAEPVQLQPPPQVAQPDAPIPPENIPLVDGQDQLILLPGDQLLIDTE